MIYEFMEILHLEYNGNTLELEKGKIYTDISYEFKNDENIKIINEIIGDLHFIDMFSDRPGFACKTFVGFNNRSDSQMYLNQETYISSQLVQNILFNSWFIKDNAMNSGEMYGIVIQEEMVNYYSVFNHDLYSNARGNFLQTSFSEVEFLKIIEYQRKLNDLGLKKFNQERYISNKLNKHFNNNSRMIEEEKIKRFLRHGKFMRSYEFIREARKTSFIPGKLSSYCSALESLVVFEKDRITSQIKNNTKKLLDYFEPGNGISKKKIDKIYNSRSIYVHGDKYTVLESGKLVGFTEDIDKILRIILRGILDKNLQEDIEGMNNEEIKQWIELL